MPSLLRPFSGYLPTSSFGHRVAEPTRALLPPGYRRTTRKDPLVFRRSAGRGARATYDAARQWLTDAERRRALETVESTVLVYRQKSADHVATGIIANVSLDAYDRGVVKRHERTVDETRRRMARYVRTTRVFGNPITLAHRPDAAIGDLISKHTAREPDTEFQTADGSSHQLWVVPGDEAETLCRDFGDDLYVTDGHHRLAAASLVAREESRTGASLPAGIFDTGQLQLRSFARAVVDPSLDITALLKRLDDEHQLAEVPVGGTRPTSRFELGAKLGDRYFRIRIDPNRIPDDRYQSLDVKLLQELILGPILGITNPREDVRLSFVPDLGRVLEEDTSSDVWFLPHPPVLEDVMSVADSGEVMPAKSTWFSPKVPSGLAIRLVDQETP